MVSFTPGWNFAPPTGLKYRCDYTLNFSTGAKPKFPWQIWESLLRCENTVDAHACVSFSARDEKTDSDYVCFLARLAGLKIQGRFENTALGFLRVPNRFFGIWNLAYFKAGIRDLWRKGGTTFGIVIMNGTRDLAILTSGNREMSHQRNRDSGIPETELCKSRSRSVGACNSHTKPMSRHFYRLIFF